MNKSFQFTETPDAHKIIAQHEGPFGAHKPMLLEFVTDHKANKLELANVTTAEKLYGKNSKYGGEDGLVDVVYIDAANEKNTDLMLKFKVIEGPTTTPLPTMAIVDQQGNIVTSQKGVYPSDAVKYGADLNYMNVENLAGGLASVIPSADPQVIYDHISNNVTYEQKPFRMPDITWPTLDLNFKGKD